MMNSAAAGTAATVSSAARLPSPPVLVFWGHVTSLLHLEVRHVRRTILKREDQDIAGIRRAWRLPVVDELIAGGIVSQYRATGRCHFDERVSRIPHERAAADGG